MKYKYTFFYNNFSSTYIACIAKWRSINTFDKIEMWSLFFDFNTCKQNILGCNTLNPKNYILLLNDILLEHC